MNFKPIPIGNADESQLPNNNRGGAVFISSKSYKYPVLRSKETQPDWMPKGNEVPNEVHAMLELQKLRSQHGATESRELIGEGPLVDTDGRELKVIGKIYKFQVSQYGHSISEL